MSRLGAAVGGRSSCTWAGFRRGLSWRAHTLDSADVVCCLGVMSSPCPFHPPLAHHPAVLVVSMQSLILCHSLGLFVGTTSPRSSTRMTVSPCPVFLKEHFRSRNPCLPFSFLENLTRVTLDVYSQRTVLLFKPDDGLILFLLYVMCSFCPKDFFFKEPLILLGISYLVLAFLG